VALLIVATDKYLSFGVYISVAKKTGQEVCSSHCAAMHIALPSSPPRFVAPINQSNTTLPEATQR